MPQKYRGPKGGMEKKSSSVRTVSILDHEWQISEIWLLMLTAAQSMGILPVAKKGKYIIIIINRLACSLWENDD